MLKNIQTKVAPAIHELLHVEALRTGITLQQLLREIIDEHYEVLAKTKTED